MAQAAYVEHDTVPCLTLARPIEVLLVDDQRAILAGVTALIESEGLGMHVAGRAMTGEQALALASGTRPDVIVLDVDLGGEDGLALIPILRARCNAAVVILSGRISTEIHLRALSLGASACVSKATSGDVLIAAIRTAANQ